MTAGLAGVGGMRDMYPTMWQQLEEVAFLFSDEQMVFQFSQDGVESH